MRWLLDQGLPYSAAGLLRQSCQEAVHVGEISMARSKDSEILQLAEKENRILVTLDSDFHAILARTGATRPSVIRLREEGLKGPALCNLMLRLAHQFNEPLESGCVLTVTSDQARLRILPILP